MSTPGLEVGVPQVYGVQEAMKALRAMEPALQREAVRKIKVAAEPMAAGVREAIPTQAPLSGMNNRGRLGWGARGGTAVKVKYGGKRNRDRNEWPLVSIVLTGAAASVYDMAGRGSPGHTPQGKALVSGLTAAGGSPSRAAWRAAEARIASVQAAVLVAVKEVSVRTNVLMTQKPRGAP